MARYSAKTCNYKLSPYLCTVFFIVLDLRLTKDWLSGIDSLFLCLQLSPPSNTGTGIKKETLTPKEDSISSLSYKMASSYSSVYRSIV